MASAAWVRWHDSWTAHFSTASCDAVRQSFYRMKRREASNLGTEKNSRGLLKEENEVDLERLVREGMEEYVERIRKRSALGISQPWSRTAVS